MYIKIVSNKNIRKTSYILDKISFDKLIEKMVKSDIENYS